MVYRADDSFFAYAEAKAAADAHLRASDLDWTVLGPGRLTLDPATGRIGIGQAKGAVSRADVALVVAAALADDSTIRRTIDFNNGDVPIAEALRLTLAVFARADRRVTLPTQLVCCRRSMRRWHRARHVSHASREGTR